MLPRFSTLADARAMLANRLTFRCEPNELRALSSIQMKLLELPVLASDPPHRAGDRAHHHGLGFDHVLAEPHAVEKRPVGEADRGEQATGLRHVGDSILRARVLDAHFPGAVALFLGVE